MTRPLPVFWRPAPLCAERIGKAFASGRQRQQVLLDLSIAIHPGELTLVLGPSGGGKSTLLAILSGLLRPDTGRVVALGTELQSLARAQLEAFRLQHTGFVFQEFGLFPALDARAQVELPLQYLGLAADEAHRRARTALEEVGMADRAQLRPAALSGGEKQRVAIARAVAKRPALLFADEPTSALDAANGRAIATLLHRVAREHGAVVLCVSHDPRLIAQADRVLRLEDGHVLADERPARRATPARVLP